MLQQPRWTSSTTTWWLRLLALSSCLLGVAGEEPLERCRVENARLRQELEALRSALQNASSVAAVPVDGRRLAETTTPSSLRGADSSTDPDLGIDEPNPNEEEELAEELLTPFFLQNVGMAMLCLTMAAVAAGLTMGMVSLEPHDMEVILRQEENDMPNDEERQRLREDKESAEKIAPLVRDHHRLLVTLLLLNSIANEALPLFLDAILPAATAVIVSVFGVLLFGEIIPSAVFTGSHQLKIAAQFTGFVRFAQSVLYPIAVPIARILDTCLGAEHKGRYNFAELRAVLGYHARLDLGPKPIKVQSVDDYGIGIITSQAPHNLGEDSQLVLVKGSSPKLERGAVYHAKPCAPMRGKRDTGCTFKLFTDESRRQEYLITFQPGELADGEFEYFERDEVKIIKGVVNITSLTAAQVMKPLSQVWMLNSDTNLTRDKLVEIESVGYSRIPVFETWAHNIRGYILAKSLIKVAPQDAEKEKQQVKDLELKELVVEAPGISLLDLLNVFQEKRCHLGLVSSHPEKVRRAWRDRKPIPCDVHMAGVVTLEDIIERILGEDIHDEHDPGREDGQRETTVEVEPALRKPPPSSRNIDRTGSKREMPKLAGTLVNHLQHHKTSPQLLQPLLSDALESVETS